MEQDTLFHVCGGYGYSVPIGDVSYGSLAESAWRVTENRNGWLLHRFDFAYLGFGTPLSVFILHGFIKGIPVALEEAATIDGCSMPGIFFKIVFPLMRPIIITVLILNGIWIWNDYLLPLLLLGSNGTVQTIPLAVRILQVLMLNSGI